MLPEEIADILDEMNEYPKTYTYRDNDDNIITEVYYRPVEPVEYINITFEINKENKLPNHLFVIDE